MDSVLAVILPFLTLTVILLLGQIFLLLAILRKLDRSEGSWLPLPRLSSPPPPEEQIIAPSEEERDLLEWQRERKSKEVS